MFLHTLSHEGVLFSIMLIYMTSFCASCHDKRWPWCITMVTTSIWRHSPAAAQEVWLQNFRKSEIFGKVRHLSNISPSPCSGHTRHGSACKILPTYVVSLQSYWLWFKYSIDVITVKMIFWKDKFWDVVLRLSQIHDQKCFIILEVAADWYELAIPKHHNTLCGHPMPAPVHIWTNDAARRHTTNLINHTKLLLCRVSATTYFPSQYLTMHRRLTQPERTVG